MSRKTQNPRTQSSPTHSDDENEESTDERVKEILQSVLCCHNRKGGLKEPEIKKILAKDGLLISSKYFEEILGVKVEKDGDRFIVHNTVKLSHRSKNILNDAKKGLLYIVLLFIYMSKNPVVKTDKIKESSLWDFLSSLGVSMDKHHPVFGDPTKLIAPSKSSDFVAHGWLSFEKVSDRDTEEIYYDWGPRAHIVINTTEMLKKYCEITGDKPEDWKEHHRLNQLKMKKNEAQTSS